MYVIINNGFFVGSRQRNFYLQCFQIFMVYFTTSVVCLPMVYRYLAVCRDYVLTGPQFALLFLTILLASSSVPLAEIYFWHPAFERAAIEQAEVINAWPCSDPGEVYLIVIAETFTLRVAPPLLIASVLIASVYGTIVICALKIKRIVASRPIANMRIQSLQRQIHYTLLVQVVTPFILFVFPIFGGLTALFTGLGVLRFFLITLFSVVSLIPTINALSTMLLIKCYRRSLLDFIAKLARWGRKIRPVGTAGATSDPVIHHYKN